jgi:hypothetical protein
MTNLTINGISTTTEKGQEQYESFYSNIKKCNLIQYDYRSITGKLFSTVRKTIEDCRNAKSEWLLKNNLIA